MLISIGAAIDIIRTINSSPHSAEHMCQWIRSALVQIMACCLFGTKPLSKPMLGYCRMEPYEQTSVKFWSKYKTLHSGKCIRKYRLPKWWPSCPGGDELMTLSYDAICHHWTTMSSQILKFLDMISYHLLNLIHHLWQVTENNCHSLRKIAGHCRCSVILC